MTDTSDPLAGNRPTKFSFYESFTSSPIATSTEEASDGAFTGTSTTNMTSDMTATTDTMDNNFHSHDSPGATNNEYTNDHTNNDCHTPIVSPDSPPGVSPGSGSPRSPGGASHNNDDNINNNDDTPPSNNNSPGSTPFRKTTPDTSLDSMLGCYDDPPSPPDLNDDDDDDVNEYSNWNNQHQYLKGSSSGANFSLSSSESYRASTLTPCGNHNGGSSAGTSTHCVQFREKRIPKSLNNNASSGGVFREGGGDIGDMKSMGDGGMIFNNGENKARENTSPTSVANGPASNLIGSPMAAASAMENQFSSYPNLNNSLYNTPVSGSSSGGGHHYVSLMEKHGFDLLDGSAQSRCSVWSRDSRTHKQKIIKKSSTSSITSTSKISIPKNKNETANATTKMFTSSDLSSITSLQITTYLTLDERKSIGTKVLSSKMMRGYSCDSHACDTCDMPKLTKNGNGVKGCAVCPVLKKRVLKKILASTSVNVHDDNGDGDVVVAKRKDATSNTNEPQEEEEEEVDEIMKARQSLFDSAKTQSYYERPSSSSSPLVQESHTTSLDFSQGRDAVAYARDVLANKHPIVVDDDDDDVEDVAKEKEGQGAGEGIAKEVVAAEGEEQNVTPRRLFDNDGNEQVRVNDDGINNAELLNEPQSLTSLPLQQALPPRPPSSKQGMRASTPPRSIITSNNTRSRPPLPPHHSSTTSSPLRSRTSSNDSLCSSNGSGASRRSRGSSISKRNTHNNHRSSSNSVCSSIASDAQSVASAALFTIIDQIEHTKRKMMETEDVNEQIAMAELLTKLSSAAVAVKKLENAF